MSEREVVSKDKVLERIFVALTSPEYNVMVRGENAHDHVMIETGKYGTWRWKADLEREQEIMGYFGATDLNDLYARCNASKNDPLIRELYRCMGYSLSGYWEIFYWEVNNEEADEWDG